MQSLQQEIENLLPYTRIIRNRIEQLIQLKCETGEDEAYAKLFSAISDAALRPSAKMLRPNVFMICIKLCGGNHIEFLDIACAIEMAHCYSLVHDDLPSMDNSETRGGQQTTHKRFGESTAVLVGDALLTMAFATIADSSAKDKIKAKVMSCLARGIGTQGMILGQQLDLNLEGELTAEKITLIHRLKTGSLMRAAAQMAAIATEKGEEVVQIMGDLGMLIGLLRQLGDDIEDQQKQEAVNITRYADGEEIKAMVKKMRADIDLRLEAISRILGLRLNEVGSDARTAKEYIEKICSFLQKQI